MYQLWVQLSKIFQFRISQKAAVKMVAKAWEVSHVSIEDRSTPNLALSAPSRLLLAHDAHLPLGSFQARHTLGKFSVWYHMQFHLRAVFSDIPKYGFPESSTSAAPLQTSPSSSGPWVYALQQVQGISALDVHVRGAPSSTLVLPLGALPQT